MTEGLKKQKQKNRRLLDGLAMETEYGNSEKTQNAIF